jgi:hypothetical protein
MGATRKVRTHNTRRAGQLLYIADNTLTGEILRSAIIVGGHRLRVCVKRIPSDGLGNCNAPISTKSASGLCSRQYTMYGPVRARGSPTRGYQT